MQLIKKLPNHAPCLSVSKMTRPSDWVNYWNLHITGIPTSQVFPHLVISPWGCAPQCAPNNATLGSCCSPLLLLPNQLSHRCTPISFRHFTQHLRPLTPAQAIRPLPVFIVHGLSETIIIGQGICNEDQVLECK